MLLLVAAGCVHAIEEESSSLGRVVRDCVVPVPAGVTALSAPVSIEYEDSSLWIWPIVETADGGLVANAAARVLEASEVCDAGPTLFLAGDGRPRSLLALSAEELEHDQTRTDGKRTWLKATGGFVNDGDAYVFYDFLEGSDIFNSESIGTGLCVVTGDAPECVRAENAGSAVLWRPEERVLNQGGLVAGDRAFVYGCRTVAALSSVCTVTGAPLDRLVDPAAYQVAGIDDWHDDLRDAANITNELGPITVSAYRGGYLLTTLDLFDQRVLVRRARDATGEFDRRIDLFGVVPTEAGFPGGGREHAGLRRNEHQLNVSYSVERGGRTELHLITFELHGEQIGDVYQPREGGSP